MTEETNKIASATETNVNETNVQQPDIDKSSAQSLPLPAETLASTADMVITAKPAFLYELFSVSSLSVFPKNVLNFDDEKKIVWYANRGDKGEGIVAASGFFTFGYAEYCRGNGKVALDSSRFLNYIEALRGSEYVTFWVNSKTKIWGIQAVGEQNAVDDLTDDSDVFTAYTDSVNEVKTATLFPFDAEDENHIPRTNDDATKLKNGCNVEISELKSLLERASKLFSTNVYKFNFVLNPPAIYVSFKDIFNPQHGANKKKLKPMDGTLQIFKEIQFIVGPSLETVVRNFKGIVSLRFPSVHNAPMYIGKVDRKSDTGDLFVAGTLIKLKQPDSASKGR